MYGLAVRFSKAEMSSEDRLIRKGHDGIQLTFLDLLCPTKVLIVT
jgi:hypothetical protein